MPCVNGLNLSENARREVLSAFGYRWTVENETKARQWYSSGGMRWPNSPPLITDAQWLASHAFHVVKDGTRLDARRRFAEPACLADDWQPAAGG